MRASLTFGLALLLVTGALSGCGKQSAVTDPTSTGGSSSVEQAAVSATLAATPELVDDDLAEDTDPVTLGGAGGALAAIQPLRFWRVIDDVDRAFVFVFADTDSTGRPTTAHVTVNKYLTGSFNVLVSTAADPASAPDSDSVAVVRKVLADHGVHRVLLKRVPLGNSTQTAWRVVAASGARITSFDPRSARVTPAYGNTRILSVRVQASGTDTTITDPLGLFRLRGITRVDALEPVTLTVTTKAADDVVVLKWRGAKFRFRDNGDGTHTGVWRAPLRAGVGHVGIDAFARGTLFDDAAPYDSQAWVLPYVVTPSLLAEYMP
jgi:hypothetical protein